MNKKYWLRGMSTGLIFGIILVIYYATKSNCMGLYLNADGSTGSACPKGFDMFLGNLTQVLNFVPIVVFVIVGAILGWLYGKISSRGGSAS